jgi:glycosyltransferase involved in cell wall biosynthesis
MQEYPNLQIIVIDGASDDGTVDLIRKNEAQIDRWASEPDSGQAEALNKGFDLADGSLFGWLCADDEYLPGALTKAAAHFEERPEIDVVTGDCLRMFPGGKVTATTPPADFVSRLDYVNTLEQPSTFWRATAQKRAGRLDQSMRYAFDWEWWCRLKRSGARFGRIEAALSKYYFSGENLTSTGGRKIADEMYRVVKAYGPYRGRLADAYRMLYRQFDLAGHYDRDQQQAPSGWRRMLFRAVRQGLYLVYDRDRIDAYNWHFAARQERGLDWE